MVPVTDDQLDRGDTPPDPVGVTPPRPPDPDPDPGFQPDPQAADKLRAKMRAISREHRPKREDVLPYLLIRATSPGDRGRRPIWPPTVCWESPDLLLVDAAYTGPFDPARLVAAPVAGRDYRVFVRVWNLGLFPATGVHVRAWAIAAGFFGAFDAGDPYYEQHQIGGAWVDLSDRRSPDCTQVVELDQPWRIGTGDAGHSCLLASVTCPADHFDGPLLANAYRHVAQRNLDIAAAAANLQPLLLTLAKLVPEGFTVELTHGGPAVAPLLQAVTDGSTPIVAPALGEIRAGVDIGASRHLLTAFTENGVSVVVPSDTLQKAVARTRFARVPVTGTRVPGQNPLAQPGGARRLLDQLGRDRWPELGLVTEEPLTAALITGIRRLFHVEELTAAAIAKTLGGPDRARHLLRLTLTTREGELVGGYSIVVG
ncbi:hypothetical protein [Hamadaea tsunoensis]|uniref:hypothetical protein n=1 Tax=Hamadaea tsunoensis TaxID=53368 RepID=UPI000421D73D|nr:hypothetical protein [Hamadaea tsunoensis]